MKLTIIAGARPNFMKIAPIIHQIEKHNALESSTRIIKYRLVHTGQHYDKRMSEVFFEQLNIPAPNANLGCGGGSQAEQTAAIMVAFEKELLANPADLVVVVGDVNSTMACAIVAKKLDTKVAHVEGGIRSFDLTMPEEINRMVTDSITDYFFTTSTTANENLTRLGVEQEQIFFVGNTMIDTLLGNQDRFRAPEIWETADLEKGKYIVMTMHRPANVDEEQSLAHFMTTVLDHVEGLSIVFPVHPRTRKVLDRLAISADHLHLTEPLPYLEFNFLMANSKAMITDSGGITEETTVLGIPCMTLRDNTERPETITHGTNELIGTDPEKIIPALEKLFAGKWKEGAVPALWDGKAAERIIESILKLEQSL